MKTAVYPGTFDPITTGHIDIIKRALTIFDKIIIAVSIDSTKIPLFTVEERLNMIKESIKDIEGNTKFMLKKARYIVIFPIYIVIKSKD